MQHDTIFNCAQWHINVVAGYLKGAKNKKSEKEALFPMWVEKRTQRDLERERKPR